jgi:hypothetical protein
MVAIEKHLLVAQKVIASPRMRGPLGYRLDPETARESERLMTDLRAAALLAQDQNQGLLSERHWHPIPLNAPPATAVVATLR